MLKITNVEAIQSNLLSAQAKLWVLDHLDYLNKPINLFGSSTKVEKGADKFDTYIMYLQPVDKAALATLANLA